MAKGEVWNDWMKENMFKVTLYVNKKNDGDIYEAIEHVVEEGGSKSAAVKNWTRLGIQAEKRKRKK